MVLTKLKKLSLALLLLPGMIYGQLPDEVVNLKLSTDRTVVRAGEKIEIIASIKIIEGWHIYTHFLKGIGPIPTHFEIPMDEVITLEGAFIEPEPHWLWDGNFNINVGWHSGEFEIRQSFQLADYLPAGEVMLEGSFVFMACTTTMCLSPAYEDFSFALMLEEGYARPAYAFEEVIGSDDPITGLEDTEIAAAIKDGLGSFLLLAIGMGFLALLTPCVFPMIPITVSYFLKQGEADDIKPIRAAGFYGIGIVIIYSVMGILLALTLGASGANQVAASPWVNMLLAALFIYFALSLFGMYEIQLPSALRQFSTSQEGRAGYMGIFFMSLTFTITSFTCTIQFVGLLLVAASRGHYLWPAIGMIMYSATFAAPFFLLALFPQYLAKLPKSGGWLNSVKVVMGFMEFAAAFKFISNTDLVWSWGMFTYQTVLASWTVILLLTGLYLLGKIRLPHDSAVEQITVPRLILSSTFLVFALLFAAGLTGAKIPGIVQAYLPPKMESSAAGGRTVVMETTEFWYEEYDEAVAAATRENRPIFMDVTGYTCTNCRWMEVNVFTKAAVQARFGEYILLRLYTDGGNNFREKQKYVIDRFGTAALPLYVLLTPDGIEIERFTGMTRDLDEFLTFLDKGLSTSQAISMREDE